MATATSIARYLFNEDSSGQTPTTVADDTGNGNDLDTITYATADMNWTSNAAGNGLDVVVASDSSQNAVAYFQDIVNNGNIGSSLNAATEASMLMRCRLTGSSDSPRGFMIGTSAGNGDFGVCFTLTTVNVRWDQDGAAGGEHFWNLDADVIKTIAIVVDTTEAVLDDRIKVYFDGVDQGVADGKNQSVGLNSTLSVINATDRYVSVMNRPSANRGVTGELYYAEIFTGKLTQTQITDSHAALAAGNDADWDGGVALSGTISAQAASVTGTLSVTSPSVRTIGLCRAEIAVT